MRLDIAGNDQILATMRQQETLIDALRICQPIVDEAAYVAGAFFANFKDKQTQAAQAISDVIDEEFAAVVSYSEILNEQEEIVIEVHALPAQYAYGDESVLEKIN